MTGEVSRMHSLHPGLILIVTGILAFVLPQKMRQIAALAGPVFALWAVWMLEPGSGIEFAFTRGITMELLHVDMLAKAFGLIFCIIALLAGIYSFDAADKSEKAAALIYAGSSLGVVFAGDWISLICFWEVMAVASWYLVWKDTEGETGFLPLSFDALFRWQYAADWSYYLMC